MANPTLLHGARLRDESIGLSKLAASVRAALESISSKANASSLGDLSALITIEKGSAVGAINEVKASATATDTALYDYVGTASTLKINKNLLQVGTSSLGWVGGLPTGSVGQHTINGLVGVGLGLAKRIGDLATLNTTDKTSAVAAINELKTAVDSKQAALGYTAENAANKGQANGYASLDETGKVPASQLPSYVDDVIESADFAALPATGESGKIYVTLDNGNIYRWSGSAYLQIGQDVGSADTALKLATARTIALGNELSGSAAFDGSGDITINATISNAALAAHFVRRAALTGTADGTNAVFTLVGQKLITDTDEVFVDGMLQEPGTEADYVLTVSGADTVVTFNAGAIPSAGSRVRISGVKA